MQMIIEKSAVFEPEAVTAMTRALSESCTALHISPGDARSRETIALRILELARGGLKTSAGLRDRLLKEARSAD